MLRLLPKRFLILGLMGAAAAAAYVTAKLYSDSLVYQVVVETLIQKAPPAVADPQVLRSRLKDGLDHCPDKAARTKRLLEIAQTLERTQRLTREELESVLRGCAGKPENGSH